MPQNLFKELETLEQVEAIVLGGSRAGEIMIKILIMMSISI